MPTGSGQMPPTVAAPSGGCGADDLWAFACPERLSADPALGRYDVEVLVPDNRFDAVELWGIEPQASSMRPRRSTN